MNNNNQKNIIPSHSDQKITKYSTESIRRGLDLATQLSLRCVDKSNETTGQNMIAKIKNIDQEKWACILTFNTSLNQIDSDDSKKLIALSCDSQLLGCVEKTEVLRIWDLNIKKIIQTIKFNNFPEEYRFSDKNPTLTFLSDNQTVALIDWDEISAWDVFSGELKYTISGSVIFALCESIIAIDEYDNSIQIRDLNTGKIVSKFKHGIDEVETIIFNKRRNLLIIAGNSYLVFEIDQSNGNVIESKTKNFVEVWDLSHKELIYVLEVGNDDRNYPSILLSPDGNILVSIFDHVDLRPCEDPLDLGWLSDALDWILKNQSSIQVWDLRTGKRLYSWPTLSGLIYDVVQIIDNSRLAILEESTIKVLNSFSGVVLLEISLIDELDFLSVSPNGSFFIGNYKGDSAIQVWDTKTGELLHTLVGHSSPIDSFVWSQDGQILITTDHSGIGMVWRSPTFLVSAD